MNTQTTPETDVWEAYCDESYYDMWRLRRKTERGWDDGFHIHTGEEAKGLCDTLNKLERERDEARERLTGIEIVMRAELGGHPDSELWGDAGLIAATMRCVDALGEVTEQRDEAREIIDAALKALPVGYIPAHTPASIPERIEDLCKSIVEAESELTAVTEQRDEAREQRDMLAKALEKVSRSWNYVEVAQQALKSLTTNAEP
jgi:hypothetical protein